MEYDADLCAHSLRSCASQSDARGSRAALFGRTLCCRTLFCDDDGAITLPLAASPGGELHLTFQPPNTAARVPRSRSERKKNKKKKKTLMVGRGEGRVGTRDLRRSSEPPLSSSPGEQHGSGSANNNIRSTAG